MKKAAKRAITSASYLFFIWLHPEDGGKIFLSNVG
jgi:hypothetical protein